MVRATALVATSPVVSPTENLQQWLGSFDPMVKQSLPLPSLRGPLLATIVVLTLSLLLHCTGRYGALVPGSGTTTLLNGAEHPETGDSSLAIGSSTLETNNKAPGINAETLVTGITSPAPGVRQSVPGIWLLVVVFWGLVMESWQPMSGYR